MEKSSEAGKNRKQIFIRNLSFDVTKDDLLKAFEEFGPLKNVSIATKKDGSAAGFGFVKL
jgi:RNA recognition motif-containing protein